MQSPRASFWHCLMVNMNVLKGSSVLKRYDDISTFAPREKISQAAQCIEGPSWHKSPSVTLTLKSFSMFVRIDKHPTRSASTFKTSPKRSAAWREMSLFICAFSPSQRRRKSSSVFTWSSKNLWNVFACSSGCRGGIARIERLVSPHAQLPRKYV